MAKKETAEKVQGTEIAKVDKEKSLEKFAETTGNYLSVSESKNIFSSGVFEEEGVNATTKMASVKDFWEERKNQKIRFIASDISTEPEGKNGPYDVVSGVYVDENGETGGLTIPSSVVVNSIKRHGLGAYTIEFLGMKRGNDNDYANFSIILKKLFKPSIEG